MKAKLTIVANAAWSALKSEPARKAEATLISVVVVSVFKALHLP